MTTAAATASDIDLGGSLPAGATAALATPPRLRLLRYEPDPDGPPPPPSSPPPTRRPHVVPVDPVDGADVRRCVERVLRLALEVLDGRRPLAQLAPHLAPSAVRYMRAAVAQRPAWREPARLMSLHVGRPGSDVAEVAVVYRRGPRARALAARFEQGRWGTGPVRVTQPAARGPDARAAGTPQWRCVTLRLL